VKQREKNLLVLLVLVGLAGGLGLYAYFGVMKPEERESQRKETAEKLFAPYRSDEKSADGGSPPTAVFTSVVVKAKGDSTTLEKKGDAWWITSPLSARADKFTAEGLIGQIQTAKFKATVEENPSDADLAKYGLDQPRFTVTARAYLPDARGEGEGSADPSRQKELVFYGGIENTFDGSVYLRRGGEKPVYAVDGFVRTSLEKSTFELRDKEVLAVDETKLKQMEFKSKPNHYLLEHEGSGWKLISPKQSPADTSTVSSMLSAFKNERATAFLNDSPAERKRVQLTAAAAKVTFTDNSGEKVAIRLSKAKIDGTEKAYALRETGKEAVLAEVPVAAVTALDKSVVDLRDKSVLSFNRDQVARITFSPGGNAPEIIAEKVIADAGSPEEWQLIAPEKAPAKKWKLTSLLWSLTSLKASGFAEENPKDWSKYGISANSKSLALADREGKVVARLQIGREVKGKSNALYVKGSRPEAMELDSARLSEIPWKLEDVIDAGTAGSSTN
jgi:hypothetical protein